MNALVESARLLAERLAAGGLLLVHGEGDLAIDAQHVSVEFMHPVMVGKRAVPAIAVGDAGAVGLLGRKGDIALGLGPAPEFLATAERAGMLALQLSAERKDDLVAQYHVLWELTHVFLDGLRQETGDFAFLYGGPDLDSIVTDAEYSWSAKVRDIETLRKRVLDEQSEALTSCAAAIADRVSLGGRVLTFGNGGSATDAASLSVELRSRGVAALCLTDEVALVTALSNDVGFEVVFARQIAALGQPGDVAVGLSTSGGSANLLAAFDQAHRLGLLTVGMAGYDGGRMATTASVDHLFVVPSTSVHRIQEAQSSLYVELARSVATVTGAGGRSAG